MNIEQAIQRVDNLERVLLQRLSDIVHIAALDLVQEIRIASGPRLLFSILGKA